MLDILIGFLASMYAYLIVQTYLNGFYGVTRFILTRIIGIRTYRQRHGLEHSKDEIYNLSTKLNSSEDEYKKIRDNGGD